MNRYFQTTLSKKFKPSNIPIYSKTLEYFSDSSSEIIQSPVLPEMPPWHLKDCSVDTSLTNCGSKHENPELLKNLALEKIKSYNNSTHIYTDASKTTENKTAAAFCVPELNIEHSTRLTDKITMFATELTAIKLDLLWVTNTLDKDISTFSDSLSSLQAIASGKSSCRPNLLLEVIALVSKYSKNQSSSIRV